MVFIWCLPGVYFVKEYSSLLEDTVTQDYISTDIQGFTKYSLS
ncbi:hypothetical protein [Clostridium estertheticum]|nr:hypothetical protein [Clostridium estertheticum]